MNLTRYKTGIGNPNAVTFNSTQGSIKQTGGYYVKPVFTDNIPMGPSGGILGHEIGKNCGINSDLNMGASKQYGGKKHKRKKKRYTKKKQLGGNYGRLSEGTSRYGVDLNQNTSDFRGSYAPIKGSSISSCALSGGGKKSYDICKSISKIKKLSDVEKFWKKNTPEILDFYNNILKKLPNNLKFIKEYTKAICHYTNAITSKKSYQYKKQYNLLNSQFHKIKKFIPKMHVKTHFDILNNLNKFLMNMYNVRAELTKTRSKSKKKTRTKSRTRSKTKSRTRRKSTSRKNNRKTKSKRKKNRRTKKRKIYKGGYHQFNSNVPISSAYQVIPSGTSNLNAPPMIEKINNCQDNYNHYTGKTFNS